MQDSRDLDVFKVRTLSSGEKVFHAPEEITGYYSMEVSKNKMKITYRKVI